MKWRGVDPNGWYDLYDEEEAQKNPDTDRSDQGVVV